MRATPSGRGRPAWLYEATDASAGAGSEYAGLAATLAAHIHRTSDNPGDDAVLAGQAWGHSLARTSGPPDGHGDVAARHKVIDILDGVGFAPEADGRATTARLTRCPLLDAASLRALADACRDAAVPPSGPLPGAYRRSALPVLERRLAAGELRLTDALAELDAAVVDLDPAVLANVNEPADLERLRA